MARRLVENKYANASMVSNPSTPVNRAIRRLLAPLPCRGNDRHISMSRDNAGCTNFDWQDLRRARGMLEIGRLAGLVEQPALFSERMIKLELAAYFTASYLLQLVRAAEMSSEIFLRRRS